MNVEYKKGTTALGMLVTVFVLVIVNLVKLVIWFMQEIAKAVKAATPEIKAQIKASAPGKADQITEKVRLRIVGKDEDELIVETPDTTFVPVENKAASFS
jgi:hypothetical protein